MQMDFPFYSSMAHGFRFFTHVMMSNDLFALFMHYFICEIFLWRNLVMGEYIFFKLAYFKKRYKTIIRFYFSYILIYENKFLGSFSKFSN